MKKFEDYSESEVITLAVDFLKKRGEGYIKSIAAVNMSDSDLYTDKCWSIMFDLGLPKNIEPSSFFVEVYPHLNKIYCPPVM